MEKWSGQVAVITGASSGIGAATAIQIAMTGILVIGLARRTQLIDDLNKQLTSSAPKIQSIYCDVRNLDSILRAFKLIEQKYGRINILVNNAGIARLNTVLGDPTNSTNNFELQNVVSTNLMGSVYTTRAAYPLMAKNKDFGYIIQINSEWGQKVPTEEMYLNFRNTYPSSKFGITALGEVIRLELNAFNNTRVRYSSISPQWVKTNILIAAGYPYSNEFFAITPHLQPKDIANNILYLLNLPKNIVITELSIRAVGS